MLGCTVTLSEDIIISDIHHNLTVQVGVVSVFLYELISDCEEPLV